MKHLKILFILIFFFSNTQAQEWSEPVLISTMQGYNDDPDFCVDNNGDLHCVWSHEISTGHRKIYYSKSQDTGDTWSEPEDISQNSSIWLGQPHIASDSENNLYVSYDYNLYDPANTLVMLKKFDGTNWSQADTISTDMNGSDHNRIVIDNNDRVYVFWFANYRIYYKFHEIETYSEIICPYNDNDLYFLNKVVSDNTNNFHCIGVYLEDGQSAYNDRTIYFKYVFSDNLWTEKYNLSENNAWAGSGICIDNSQLPHLTWREPTTDTPPYNDATFYASFDGTNWSSTEIVIEDPKYQTIAIDQNNNVHIANQEKLEKTKESKAIPSKLVHYQKYQDDWEGIVIDECGHEIANSKILYYDQKLFINYSKCHEVGEDLFVNIFSSKYQVSVNISENTIKEYQELKQNYPNPFKYHTTIHFELNKPGETTLKILDLKGNLITTLISEYKQKGTYNTDWNGTNQNNKKVSAGLYLYRLQVGNRVKTRSLIVD